MMETPIFQSVGQALHVSYLMEILPVTQRCSTQVLIETMREQLGKVEARLASSINAAGLTPLQFRGQCALVVASAAHHLPVPEHAAVRARFGHQATKGQGVIALTEYLQPMTGIDKPLAVRAVVWERYHRGSQRAADRWSLASIESETGVPQAALRKCKTIVRDVGEALEKRAQERLQVLFARTGLVEAELMA